MKPPRILLAGLCLGLAVAWAGAAWAELQPYSARYSIYRNGKLSGKLEVRLAQEGERWTLRSELSGTHGLARILRARDTEHVVGKPDDEGRFVPDEHVRHTRVAGVDDRWVSSFDWAADRVAVVHDGKAEHGGFYQSVADGTYAECGLDVTIVPGGPQVMASSPQG